MLYPERSTVKSPEAILAESSARRFSSSSRSTSFTAESADSGPLPFVEAQTIAEVLALPATQFRRKYETSKSQEKSSIFKWEGQQQRTDHLA